jgi:hypothetical protein
LRNTVYEIDSETRRESKEFYNTLLLEYYVNARNRLYEIGAHLIMASIVVILSIILLSLMVMNAPVIGFYGYIPLATIMLFVLVVLNYSLGIAIPTILMYQDYKKLVRGNNEK